MAGQYRDSLDKATCAGSVDTGKVVAAEVLVIVTVAGIALAKTVIC